MQNLGNHLNKLLQNGAFQSSQDCWKSRRGSYRNVSLIDLYIGLYFRHVRYLKENIFLNCSVSLTIVASDSNRVARTFCAFYAISSNRKLTSAV